MSAGGLAVGVLFGIFGVGGSSFATPLLGALGVPGLVAVAAPLPATVPAAIAGMVSYVRRRQVDWAVARWSIIGGAPATIAGGLLSGAVGGSALLVASGVVLGVVGARLIVRIPEERLAHHVRRRAAVVVPSAAAVGLLTGLLANGGGFLLVPLFVLVLGLTMPESAGTSLVVIAVLSLPTLAVHWVLGHIDWSVSLAFAAGSVPGAAIGSRLAPRLPAEAMRRVFGAVLIAFAISFVARQVAS
ncbi:MAG: sulfite exporter TauE/SafE family protein [Actinobacteria bacterium]|nr:sulfite exporter TauE/SafE family protein [Actinomycetota bacterium]